MYKATDKQLKFIKAIEEFVGEEFTGTTKKEASEYISRNIDEFNREQAKDEVLSGIQHEDAGDRI